MSKIVVNGHFKVVLVKQLVLEVETLRIPGSSIQASPLAADLGEKRQVFTSVSEKAFCTSCASTENEEYCCIFGELSGGGGAEVPALAIPRGSARKHFHTDAPMGRRCESAFALLSHKKVTKRLWPAASYGKIGVVGYRLL